MAELTPMMKQYTAVKEQHSDAILMFRLGDFYEMFFEDAITASRELELTLTGRDCGQEERAPMCGVPFHAAEGYISRLVAKGYKVAICEQTEDPAAAKGIVRREVIRIVTPGTIMDENVLAARRTNYMAALLVNKKKSAMTFCDVSTGELLGCVVENDATFSQLINELARFSPVEVAIGGTERGNRRIGEFLANRTNAVIFEYDSEEASKGAKEIVSSQIKNVSAVCDEDLMTTTAALLSYIHETQKGSAGQIREISVYASHEFMEIDAASVRNLELVETMRDKSKKGSLFDVLDYTKTAMGARELKTWILRPLVNANVIVNRQRGVEELVNNTPLREELAESIARVWDMERLMSRVSMGLANARDLNSLKASLEQLPRTARILCACKSTFLVKQASMLDVCEDCRMLLDAAVAPEPPITLREGRLIREGYSEEVDALRSAAKGGREWIAALEATERERTGIKNLKVGFNKVFGYYIEVSRVNLDKVPEDYVRKQTIANGERYITARLKEMESSVLGAQEKLVSLEYDLFVKVRLQVAESLERIMRTARVIANVDAALSLAQAAVLNNYVKPTITNSDVLKISGGRHPVVEKVQKDALFVPNDTLLDCAANRANIITGPNMAGKSTYMRQSAIIALMAQMGSFVPAAACECAVVDKIFTRIGASDDLAAGQSTFMIEMTEVAYILKHATKKSLVILDEIGRGTSTFDGLAIAWAVMEHMTKRIGAKTLFATHYHELTALEDLLEGVKNYNTACKKRGDEITFLRKIVRGGTSDSYGIEVAKLAGVPESVIKRAKEVLAQTERGETREVNIKTEEAQIGFESITQSPCIEKLRSIDVTTLTPIEALNTLYELQKMAEN
ncbi:MAG: DNA mismatch repair protein MutS [Clostridia bacterium]|nr:DNA mismatch repair protein MutS [Clostridia bacterium]